jgi:endonuclease/exonuclease/phosphatase family metal-dependent hydrolase
MLFINFRAAPLPATILLVLIIYSFSSFSKYFQWHSSATPIDEGLTVMSYNTMMGAKMVNEKHVMTAEIKNQFTHLINIEPLPDIICAQETNWVVEKIFATGHFPYYHKIDNRGAVILSKYPFLNTGIVDFGAKLNSCLWVDIEYKGKTIRIYSAHLESNRLKKESYKMLAEEDYVSEQTINGIEDMIFKYHKYTGVRADQAEKIQASIQQSPFPVILCGDFNDPPMSYTYRTLSRGLVDAFEESGRGIGTTWQGIIPFLRIDYIMYDPAFRSSGYARLNSQLSDHYPIKAVIDLK